MLMMKVDDLLGSKIKWRRSSSSGDLYFVSITVNSAEKEEDEEVEEQQFV